MRFQRVAGACALGAALVLCREPVTAALHPFVSRAAPALAMSLLVKLPLRNAAELESLTRVQSDPQSPEYHRFLSVAQFRERYGPLPDTMQSAADAIRASGLNVTERRSQRRPRVTASVADVERAFAVRMGVTRDARGGLRIAADTAPTLPGALAALHATVIGLSEERVPRPQVRRAGIAREPHVRPWRVLVRRSQAGVSLPVIPSLRWARPNDRRGRAF